MEYDSLVQQVGAALENGSLDPRDVQRLLRRKVATAASQSRPGVAGVLRALGVLTVFAGAALLYGIQFANMPSWAQHTTPLIFPIAALGAALALHRAGRPVWEVELAGAVGYIATGLALFTIGVSAHAGSRFGVAASAVAVILALVMHRLLGLVRLTSWGLSASLVSLSAFAAAGAGMLDHNSQWLLLAEALGAAVIGFMLLERSPEGAAGAWRSAALLGYSACLVGIDRQPAGFDSLGPWQAALTLLVIAVCVAAALRDFVGLLWTGALGGLVWLAAIGLVVGRSSGWAVAVVLLGLGLVGLAVLVGRFGRHRRGTAALGTHL